jgi:hypothetical protein
VIYCELFRRYIDSLIHRRVANAMKISEFGIPEQKTRDSRPVIARTEILRSLTKKQESFAAVPHNGMKPFLSSWRF